MGESEGGLMDLVPVLDEGADELADLCVDVGLGGVVLGVAVGEGIAVQLQEEGSGHEAQTLIQLLRITGVRSLQVELTTGSGELLLGLVHESDTEALEQLQHGFSVAHLGDIGNTGRNGGERGDIGVAVAQISCVLEGKGDAGKAIDGVVSCHGCILLNSSASIYLRV